MNAALLLAEAELNTDTITPGVLGFIIIALVAAALYFLMKSMKKHLGTVQANRLDEKPEDKVGQG
ncbi:MAG: hypothetical protein M0026_03785 [Nocardiopsaceae bacterium]|nr:hypothetical protein [Nocardiopsaceae bacterium]